MAGAGADEQRGVGASSRQPTGRQRVRRLRRNDGAGEIISGDARIKSAKLFDDFASQAEAVVEAQESEELDNMVHKLMKPMLKDWLDNNLPDMVESIVREELRRLVPKK